MSIPTITQVCERAQRLPCSPVLLPRLIKVLEDENSSSQDVEEIICMDTALAGGTLRIANSAFFGASGRRVESIAEAVVRLGSREIYRLAALSLAGRWMSFPVGGFLWEPGDFCRRSLVTAVASEYLARQTGRVDPSTAYTAGLLIEIGKLAIAYSCAENFPAMRQYCALHHCSWDHAEKEILGFDYMEVGSELLRRWNFPPSLVAVTRTQTPTPDMPEAVLGLTVHVHAGKYIAASIGAGVAEDGFLFDFNSPVLIEWGFTPETLDAAMPEVLERASKLLGDRLLHGEMKF
ncbi:MAG TPA: HDOD domain-containing protein [Opitutaceae bacterium]|jgi:HD-like signal output (HDOD) protein|nr:MAG: HDOD domain protein [Verrucomicrobia bacterium ADurb.Bin122]HOD46376.1 HDOD domain-containing protein [Opitutaceae bacterium]HOF09390.1 HDOD domain-containing protein [Opitutaceae bacterium]HOG92320.1 HDOD domain-containing protein [Opitutaceae bacterium]HOR24392.1 HDOD domain-containing protein [Opitutaceae bacterium]